MRRVTISMFVAACAVSTVSAAEREIPLRDVTSVTSQRGAARVLFLIRMSAGSEIRVKKAVLLR